MVNHDAPHQLSGRRSSWVASYRVDRASSYGPLDAANSNTAKGFFTARPEAIEKTAQPWRVSVALSAYAHEPAQTTNTPEKTKTKTLERKNHANQTISN
jgi:hypothetical protein